VRLPSFFRGLVREAPFPPPGCVGPHRFDAMPFANPVTRGPVPVRGYRVLHISYAGEPAPACRWQSRNEARLGRTAPGWPLCASPPDLSNDDPRRSLQRSFRVVRSVGGRFSIRRCCRYRLRRPKGLALRRCVGGTPLQKSSSACSESGRQEHDARCNAVADTWSLQPPWLRTKLQGRLLVSGSRAEESECSQ
jgi:hypothetical protein